jgi:hypothetical protein
MPNQIKIVASQYATIYIGDNPAIMRFVEDRNGDFIRRWKAIGADI